jgi:hypothetical protein
MLVEKKQKHNLISGNPEIRYYLNTSCGHRRANKQLPASIRFVKVAGASLLFVEKFQ